jgi:hypothetical protein
VAIDGCRRAHAFGGSQYRATTGKRGLAREFGARSPENSFSFSSGPELRGRRRREWRRRVCQQAAWEMFCGIAEICGAPYAE